MRQEKASITGMKNVFHGEGGHLDVIGDRDKSVKPEFLSKRRCVSSNAIERNACTCRDLGVWRAWCASTHTV